MQIQRIGRSLALALFVGLSLALLASAAAVERAVEVARRRADAKRVDQAILARAFHGEL